LNTDATSAWKKLAQLDEVHNLVSFLASAEVEGDKRVCHIAPGAPMSGALEEVILGVDETLRRVSYSITSSPFGFTHHAASMQITESPDGTAHFVWTTDVKPDAIVEAMGGMFESEADHIAAQLAD